MTKVRQKNQKLNEILVNVTTISVNIAQQGPKFFEFWLTKFFEFWLQKSGKVLGKRDLFYLCRAKLRSVKIGERLGSAGRHLCDKHKLHFSLPYFIFGSRVCKGKLGSKPIQPLHCQRYALLSPTYRMDLGDYSYNDWLTSAQECLDFAWDVDKPNVVVFCWVPADTMCMWTDQVSVVGCFKNGTGKCAGRSLLETKARLCAT